jgi:DNA-binding beta-propeller fold protein YncE
MKSLGLSRYAFPIGAAAALLAGCGGAQSPIVGQGVSSATFTAPKATGQNTPLARHGSGQRLFVTEYTRNTVLVYDASAKNPRPERHITIGLAQPTGACIDASGTLYVVNAEGWISEYPAGRSRPTRIIKKGLGEPVFCAIDGAGNLWVTDPYVFRLKRRSGPSLTEYKPGSKKPATIIMKGLSNPLGVAIDQSGNIYVANRIGSSSGNVVVYAPGQKTPYRTITDGITSPVGIAIDANGTLYVANIFQNTVAEFKSGASEPYQTITQGLADPIDVSVNEQGWLYVVNDGSNSIAEFAPGSLEPSERQISKDLYAPEGSAYSPPVLP